MTVDEFRGILRRLPNNLPVYLESENGEILPANIEVPNLVIDHTNRSLFGLLQCVKKRDQIIYVKEEPGCFSYNLAQNSSKIMELLDIEHCGICDTSNLNRNMFYFTITGTADKLNNADSLRLSIRNYRKKFIELKKLITVDIMFQYKNLQGLQKIDNLVTSIFYGIGLNKRPIENIPAGSALVISKAVVPIRQKSICDLSLFRNNIVPRKYTKLSMNLFSKHDNNRVNR